jgi:sugar (pentulose or hexulose) kinase
MALDENDQVIRPSIIWCDQRTTEQAAYLNDLVGAEKLLEITANPALPYFTASKLLWVRQHEPENFAKIKKDVDGGIMSIKDAIALMGISRSSWYKYCRE